MYLEGGTWEVSERLLGGLWEVSGRHLAQALASGSRLWLEASGRSELYKVEHLLAKMQI